MRTQMHWYTCTTIFVRLQSIVLSGTNTYSDYFSEENFYIELKRNSESLGIFYFALQLLPLTFANMQMLVQPQIVAQPRNNSKRNSSFICGIADIFDAFHETFLYFLLETSVVYIFLKSNVCRGSFLISLFSASENCIDVYTRWPQILKHFLIRNLKLA